MMYNKVQVDSWVLQLEKDLEEARLKWVDLAKERANLFTDVLKSHPFSVHFSDLFLSQKSYLRAEIWNN